MPVDSEWVQLATRLAEGARAQALRDHKRYEGIMKLPLHVYHVADSRCRESIDRYGLLSTQQLYELTNRPRDIGELRSRRVERIPLSPSIVLRDQRLMSPSSLKRCLVGITREDWYELLNGFVFFWFDRAKAEILSAKYENSIILKFDFRKLLFAHEDCSYLTPINTGSTAYNAAPRSRATFVPWKQWINTRWATEETSRGMHRKRPAKPVEFAIAGTVERVSRFLVSGASTAP
jgi:hypothetical protein